MKVPFALLLAGGELPLRQPDPCRGHFLIPPSWPVGADEQGTFNIIDVNGHQALRCSVREGHGPHGLDGALSRSCNVWFLHQAASDPARSFALLVRRFALDRPAGARLRQYLPEPAQTVAARPGLLQMAAACVGEGGAIRLSPLKVAQVFGAIWSGTPLLAPTDADALPAAAAPLELDNAARNRVRSVMTRVVAEGTLAPLGRQRFNGLRLLGGKTGTATHYRKRYATHGWNVIVYEHGNETLVLTVFVHDGSGPREAAAVSAVLLRELYK
jgi:cell division protein FtsI/penicillin-binding protein 2